MRPRCLRNTYASGTRQRITIRTDQRWLPLKLIDITIVKICTASRDECLGLIHVTQIDPAVRNRLFAALACGLNIAPDDHDCSPNEGGFVGRVRCRGVLVPPVSAVPPADSAAQTVGRTPIQASGG